MEADHWRDSVFLTSREAQTPHGMATQGSKAPDLTQKGGSSLESAKGGASNRDREAPMSCRGDSTTSQCHRPYRCSIAAFIGRCATDWGPILP